MSNREPPATPEAPHAAKVEITHNMIVTGNGTDIPIVWQVARVITVIVIAAPSILIVEPSGILIEKKSLSIPSLSHRFMFTGMFAAELLEKNAVIPLSRRHVKTNGYGLRLNAIPEIKGSVTKATNAIHPTSNKTNWPYSVKILKPLWETEVNTKPMIPIGAHCIMKRTTLVTASAMSVITSFVVSLATIFKAIPKIIDQNRIPKYSPSAKDLIGFENIFKIIPIMTS